MKIKVDDSISLELLDDKHAQSTFQLIDGNRQYLKQWLPWVDNMATEDDFKGHILDSKDKYLKGTDWPGVIIVDGEAAGRMGMHYIHAQNKIGAIGYWLAPQFQGKGIITKACRAMINYGFETMGLNRIEIKCGTGNYKSLAVPERLHFTKEGVLRQGEFLYGHFIDLYIYAMLKDEWITTRT